MDKTTIIPIFLIYLVNIILNKCFCVKFGAKVPIRHLTKDITRFIACTERVLKKVEQVGWFNFFYALNFGQHNDSKANNLAPQFGFKRIGFKGDYVRWRRDPLLER